MTPLQWAYSERFPLFWSFAIALQFNSQGTFRLFQTMLAVFVNSRTNAWPHFNSSAGIKSKPVASLCLHVFIFFHHEGFFWLQDVKDILERYGSTILCYLGAFAKFLHLCVWKCHISPPKTKTSATANWRENSMIYWWPVKR